MFCSRDMVQEDVRARHDITVIKQLGMSGPFVGTLADLAHHNQHWAAETKSRALDLWEEQGWSAVRLAYPTLPWVTAAYWRKHPESVVERYSFRF